MLDRIKSSTDISLLFSEGKRFNSADILIIARKNTQLRPPAGRVAFVAGKKNGNAVWRNRAKRRMRELARECGAPWGGVDVVFVAKRTTTQQAYYKILQQVQKAKRRVLEECN